MSTTSNKKVQTVHNVCQFMQLGHIIVINAIPSFFKNFSKTLLQMCIDVMQMVGQFVGILEFVMIVELSGVLEGRELVGPVVIFLALFGARKCIDCLLFRGGGKRTNVS
jgi:hypothetical protein